jgi:hypothetical protein
VAVPMVLADVRSARGHTVTVEYPFVECVDHPGRRQHGFVVCAHVFAGAIPTHFIDATDRRLGEALCVHCEGASLPLSQLRVVCRLCLEIIVNQV